MTELIKMLKVDDDRDPMEEAEKKNFADFFQTSSSLGGDMRKKEAFLYT